MTIRRRKALALLAGVAFIPAVCSRWSARAEIALNSRDGDILIDIFAGMLDTGRAYLPAGTYKISKPLVIPPGVIEGGDVILDFRDADPADFPAGICVLVRGAARTRLPDLQQNLSIGTRTLKFERPHELAVGDTFQLSGVTDFAGNGHRWYYRKGEMFRVARVTGSHTLITEVACRDDYRATEVEIWKRPGDHFTQACASLTILGPDDIDFPIRFVGLDDANISNVRAEGGAHTAIAISDCFGVHGEKLSARQTVNTHDGYGIMVINSQNIRLKGHAAGFFNGFVTGGGDPKGGKIGMNRDIHFEGFGSSDPVGGLSGANFHGNTEYSSFRGTFMNGVALAGNKNEAHGDFIDGSGYSVLTFAEMHGHDFKVTGTVRTSGKEIPPQIAAIHQPDFGPHARYGGRTLLDLRLYVKRAERILAWRPTNLSRTDIALDLRLDIVEAHPKARIMALRKNGEGGYELPSVALERLNLIDDAVPIRWFVSPLTKLNDLGARVVAGHR